MNKPNLILINGFAVNKKPLKGFISYLNEFFKVYVIDLPGHGKNPETIETVTLNNIVEYADKKIQELNIKNYTLAGISFGFLVASKTNAIKKSKGVVAIEPYLDSDKLRIGEFKGKIVASIMNIICKTQSYQIAWESKFLRILLKKQGYNKNIMDLILSQTEPKSFFEIAKIILTNRQPIKFYNKPYVLIINKDDEFLNAEKEIKEFKKKSKKLMIIYSTSDHVPKNPTKKYFEKHLSRKEMMKIRGFIKKNT